MIPALHAVLFFVGVIAGVAALYATARLAGHQHPAIEMRLTRVERRLERGDRRFDAVDQRFDEVDKQFVEMRREIQCLPTLLAQLEEKQTRDIKQHIDSMVGIISNQQKALAQRVRSLEDHNDRRDGLIPRIDDEASAFPSREEK